ncbi:hypothetical protein ASE08_21400 [Rhizobacter sp. Root16D2]|nr:hypothetical protein ASC88_28555 [Rhizobacter sp. Root29]KQW03895.1 hypothetical protein ASC98_26725 [Rhizobacter sp. Root1238]KRB21534.1 hypothetical protein ASE08_21400 [Rhizobacter sp. Root16D2]
MRYYYSDNVVDSTGRGTYYDVREAQSGGKPAVVVYDTVQFVTAEGWHTPLDGATPNHSGPNGAYDYNHGYIGQSTSADTDVAGQTIASVVAKAQDLGTNTSSTIVGVTAANLTGVMPAGAKIRSISNTESLTPVGYRLTDGFVGNNVTTLAGLVTSYPAVSNAAAVSTANTVSMGNLHGSNGCGAQVCLQERMRGSFNADGTVSLHLCDLDTVSGVFSNCSSIGTASYQSTTALDGATPIMTFSGLPAAVSIQTFTRVFVQRGGHVYLGFQDKPAVMTKQTRLNKVAFEALAASLGVTPPVIPAHPATTAGTWSVTYAGGDTGSCTALSVNAAAHVIGTCTSSGVGGSFIVSGTVDAVGGLSVGSTSSDASFTGTLGAATGSGTWSRPSASATGTWAATKQ